MSDLAQQLALTALASLPGRILWIVDEQLAAAPAHPRAGVVAISNRCDVVEVLRRQGFAAQLSDFDIAAVEGGLDAVVYRISKEKAVVHHVINNALTQLCPGGELHLIGGKNEGIKTYLDKAAKHAGGELRIQRHGPVWHGIVVRGGAPGSALDDQRYTELREMVADDGLSVWSKPGVYGWQKIDVGSKLLADQFATAWPQAPANVLDIGCGYGYLSLRAAQRWSRATITATDNNVAAVAACKKNLLPYHERAEVVLADCAHGIEQHFEAVICNPPFHQGFDIDSDLTMRFLQSARAHLQKQKQARALFVVNQFIAIERKAQPLFREVRELVRAQGFKVILLQP